MLLKQSYVFLQKNRSAPFLRASGLMFGPGTDVALLYIEDSLDQDLLR
jgi:hypothetical protein